MNPDMMEEMDFSPLNEVIATQEALLEDFKTQVEEMQGTIDELNYQLAELLVRADEFENGVIDRNDALTEIRQLVARFV